MTELETLKSLLKKYKDNFDPNDWKKAKQSLKSIKSDKELRKLLLKGSSIILIVYKTIREIFLE